MSESPAAGVLREGSLSGATLSSLSCLVKFSASGLQFERKEVGGTATGLREGAQTSPPRPSAPAQLGELALIEQCLRDIYLAGDPLDPPHLLSQQVRGAHCLSEVGLQTWPF